jgi:hypothetical protein
VKPWWSRRKGEVVAGAVGTLLAVAYLVVAIFYAPRWAAADITSSKPEAQATARATERGSVRTAMLAVLAGGIAVVGAVYTGRTFALNRRGQLTERFTRAIELLGEEEKKLDVRLGGIYALERLAQESWKEHGPVVEILCAYVRNHAPVKGTPEEGTPFHYAPAEAPVDIKAVMTVLARRREDHDERSDVRLDLRKTELRGVNAPGLRAEKAMLDGAYLKGAILCGADLQGASLGAADLEKAGLEGANLQGAYLMNANLEGANLRGADLQRAGLVRANLRGASLEGANLQGAYLASANLQGAKSTRKTRWPEGFDDKAAGVLRREPEDP